MKAYFMENILGWELSSGFVITKYGHGLNLQKVKVLEAGHPVPDENSLKGARSASPARVCLTCRGQPSYTLIATKADVDQRTKKRRFYEYVHRLSETNQQDTG